jgi:hypothetical protein
LQVGWQRCMSQAVAVVLCFAGWLSEGTASHLAQYNTLWSNVEYSHHKVYCVVCSLHRLCSLQPDNQPAKHNMYTPNCVSVQRCLLLVYHTIVYIVTTLQLGTWISDAKHRKREVRYIHSNWVLCKREVRYIHSIPPSLPHHTTTTDTMATT